MKSATHAIILSAVTALAATFAGAQQVSIPVPISLAVPAGLSAFAATDPPAKDDLFAGTEKFAQGASDVTEVNLDPKMMGMVGGQKGSGDLARRMNFMVIHTYKYDKPDMYKMEDVEIYRKKLTDGSWTCSIHVRDKHGSTDICSRMAPNHEGSEMVILTAEPKELTFIHMSGHMSLDDLGKMSGSAGGDTDGLKKR